MVKRSFINAFGPSEARMAYNAGAAVYRGYKRARAIIRGRRGWTADLPGIPDTGGRSPPGNWPFGGQTSGYNNGYHIKNVRARNVKRRRKYSKKRRIRSLRRNKIRNAGIAGKLMSRAYRKLFCLNEIENDRGRVALLNNKNPITNIQYCPINLFDISYVGTDDFATNTKDDVAFQIRYDDAATVKYRAYNNLILKENPYGESSGNTYKLLTANSYFTKNSVESADKRKFYQHNVHVDLLMYGKKDHDTMYRVDVVQFEPAMIDMWRSGSTSSEINASEYNQFWYSLLAPYMMNPLVKRARGKFMKVLKTYKFKIPEGSNDYDQQPMVKTKLKIPINRIRDRYWRKDYPPESGVANPVDPEDIAIANVGDQDAAGISYGDGFLHPKKRTFLMIRCTNTKQNSDDLSDGFQLAVGEEPTYDIQIRTCFSYNP